MTGNKPYRKKLTLIFSGGGTGGHIYPALAVADKIRLLVPDAEVLFIGAKGKMEMSRVPQHGYEIIGLWISGLQRKLTFANLLFPFKVIDSYLKSVRILKKVKPDVVAGFGGYASSPIMLAATRMGIKTVVQEQNSYAGIANKAVAGRADRFCVAYGKMDRFFPADKIRITGNPVRSDIGLAKDRKESFEYFNLNAEVEVVLVLGGSLGARTINESIIQNIEAWMESGKQLLWQTGKLYYEEMQERVPEQALHSIHVLEYIDRMDLAYAAADIVISRAGALSISELCLVSKPVIFVPSPNVAEDHQTKNAHALVERDAAVMVKDKEAVSMLAQTALQLLKDNDKMEQLASNISKLGKPEATQDIADEILTLAGDEWK